MALNYRKEQIKCVGVTNQRETTIVWDKNTGKEWIFRLYIPLHIFCNNVLLQFEKSLQELHRAIVWSDSRSAETAEKLIAEHGCKDVLREKCGLPLASYFSALKIKWLMDNEPKIGMGLI